MKKRIIRKYKIEVAKEDCRKYGVDFWEATPEELIEVWWKTAMDFSSNSERPDDGGELMKPWVRRNSSPVPFAEVEFEQQEEVNE